MAGIRYWVVTKAFKKVGRTLVGPHAFELKGFRSQSCPFPQMGHQTLQMPNDQFQPFQRTLLLLRILPWIYGL